MITPKYIEQASYVTREVGRVIFGKEFQTRQIFAALLAGGHILLEDIPGVGKTTLALALARTLDLEYRRVQFTPDLMPSDLTGFTMYSKKMEKFVFRPGTVFCNLLLADEINRTSPKTQSALLEVMEEKKVTAEGVTRPVPDPFLIIATQNPAGSLGTQPLPESQMDRFLISMSVGYPDPQSELRMIQGADREVRLSEVRTVLNRDMILQMKEEVKTVYISDETAQYILRLVEATRRDGRIKLGASPRAALALSDICRASAYLAGREYVTPQDAADEFPYVMRHRLILSSQAKAARLSAEGIANEILRSVERPHVVRRK